jgi:hypothetical protein
MGAAFRTRSSPRYSKDLSLVATSSTPPPLQPPPPTLPPSLSFLLPPPLSSIAYIHLRPPYYLHPDAISRDPFDLREVPLLVTQGTYAPGLQPPLDAIEVEYVSAIPEGDA